MKDNNNNYIKYLTRVEKHKYKDVFNMKFVDDKIRGMFVPCGGDGS